MDEIVALKAIPMFSTMDEKELRELRTVMESQRFLPGQIIIREGEEGAYFYILMAGGVQYLTTDAEDKEVVLDEAGPGRNRCDDAVATANLGIVEKVPCGLRSFYSP